jgi:hypothetical protein
MAFHHFCSVAASPELYALAQNHQQICVPSVINGKHVSFVSKEKLAKAILNQNFDAQAPLDFAKPASAQYCFHWPRGWSRWPTSGL